MFLKLTPTPKLALEAPKGKKLFIYMSRPKNIFEPHHNPKNSPLGPQKAKNIPKWGQNQKLELKKV